MMLPVPPALQGGLRSVKNLTGLHFCLKCAQEVGEHGAGFFFGELLGLVVFYEVGGDFVEEAAWHDFNIIKRTAGIGVITSKLASFSFLAGRHDKFFPGPGNCNIKEAAFFFYISVIFFD